MKNKLLILYRTIMTTRPAQRDKQNECGAMMYSLNQKKYEYILLPKNHQGKTPTIDIFSAHTP